MGFGKFLSMASSCVMGLVCLVIMLMGFALIVVGGLVLLNTSMYQDFLTKGFFSVPAFILTVGVIVVIVFFFGCLGAFKNSSWMITVFAVIITLVVILEVSGLIAAYFLRGQVEEVLKISVNESFHEQVKDNKTRLLWNDVQTKLHCCGVESPKDFANISLPVPPSCNSTDGIIFQTGCIGTIEDVLKENASSLIEWTGGLFAFQIILAIMACFLGKASRGGYETV